MSLRPLTQRVVHAYARKGAFVDKTIPILGRLGYRILSAESDAEALAAAGEPELLIADEAHIDALLEGEAGQGLPIVLLSGRHGVTRDASNIVGAIRRPAGLHDLYRVIQQVFEDTPRTTPRVPTDLRVECGRNGESFAGALLSLSENGGLLRCETDLPLGACFQMHLDLPEVGPLEVRAEAAYQLVPDLGVVFSGLDPSARVAIGDFVSGVLLD